ncbi:MAG: ABC transporter permease [Chloroflexi bacterium]|nr:ABC transporter permease [Chloroflexota bacterium]
MKTLLKLSWVELKLFTREPITAFFTLALPLIFLFVMGEVFGNTPDTSDFSIYRGVGAMNYYTPMYIGLVMSAIGLLSIPVHLAGYRERGVLRRLRASSISIWHLFASQLIVTFILTIVCSIILDIAAFAAYDVLFPKSVLLLIPAFILSGFCFASLGILLGALFTTGRAALGIGLILFFIMLMLGGSGPPIEVMSPVMKTISDVMPLTHAGLLLQDTWLGFGWNIKESLIVTGFFVGTSALAIKLFRWD